MNRYFIKLAYEGTNFHGWQVQDNANTVQGELNKCLETLLQEKINVVGCGRTDTGVHASEFYAHFELEKELSELSSLQFRLNCLLPQTIGIDEIWPVGPLVHSRFSAIARTYEYHIAIKKDPFSQNRTFFYHKNLDLATMNKVAEVLLNTTDFTTFSKSKTQVKTNNCDVRKAFWEMRGNRLVFTIQADRFLRNMVRAVVGTLMLVGEGKMNRSEFEQIVKAKDRKLAGPSVPAAGLYLTQVDYPEGLLIAVEKA